MKQKFALGGSGSSYIYGLVDSTYRDGMTKQECQTFVKNGIYFYKKCERFSLSHTDSILKKVILKIENSKKECHS